MIYSYINTCGLVFHTISHFPNSTRVAITVYQHRKCFVFVNENMKITSSFIIFRWGAPARLLSDQGREFVAKVNDEVCREFGIKRSVTSAYHPQTNGLDERTNQTLKQRLSKLVNEHQNNWCDFLDEVAYSIRTQKQASTKYTPFYLMFGRNPNSAQMVFKILYIITVYVSYPNNLIE